MKEMKEGTVHLPDDEHSRWREGECDSPEAGTREHCWAHQGEEQSEGLEWNE